MAEPFIHHLHIIYSQLNYTYAHIYILKAYIYNLKALKSLKPIKHIKLKLDLAPINLKNGHTDLFIHIFIKVDSKFIKIILILILQNASS